MGTPLRTNKQKEVERIIESLSRAIAQHMLPPGTRLVEAQIVDSLKANRNHVQAAVLQVVLTQAGIPFMVHSGVKFFEQAHIKDLTAFLKVLYNPLDEIAWMRLLRMLPGIGNTTANKIFMVFREQQAVRLTQENETLQKLIPAKSREEWQTMTGCLRNLLRDDLTPSEMIGIVYRDFYREVMYSEFENALMRENDVLGCVCFAVVQQGSCISASCAYCSAAITRVRVVD